MSCDDTRCQCCGLVSEEQVLEQIAEIIDYYKSEEKSLVQILHAVQSIYGYLPLAIQSMIAQKVNKPLSEVSGVVSFYSHFSALPKGRHKIKVCMGTACYVRGGKKLLESLENTLGIVAGETTDDRKFTLEVARCIGACGFAPAMMIDETVYKQVNPDKLDTILAKY